MADLKKRGVQSYRDNRVEADDEKGLKFNKNANLVQWSMLEVAQSSKVYEVE